jgi:MoaA/NifB/PqqE/SkfB family radical SAM enzyme
MGQPAAYFVDPRFVEHFRRVQQVFIYINDQCNLSCRQCIYKPHVTYHNDREIPQEQAMGLLQAMRDLGAHKVTFLGGEPTLYGRRSENSLRDIIRFCRSIGYSYIRMDTNGLFPEALYEAASLVSLDELAFSLDGYDSHTNDMLRGVGTFPKINRQILRANKLGVQTSITCCIHRYLVDANDEGITGVERVIRLGEELGVGTVNFHDLFKAGVPMDTWTGDFNTTVEQHVEMYEAVRPKIDRGDFKVDVRLPQCFVRRSTFESKPQYFGYCPVKLGERVMIHSDGIIRICSNLICSSFGTAYYTADTITWNSTPSNEMSRHDLTRMTPCTNRSQNMKYGDYVPLCFSFKPGQTERSWNALAWDEKGASSPIQVSSEAP